MQNQFLQEKLSNFINWLGQLVPQDNQRLVDMFAEFKKHPIEQFKKDIIIHIKPHQGNMSAVVDHLLGEIGGIDKTQLKVEDIDKFVRYMCAFAEAV